MSDLPYGPVVTRMLPGLRRGFRVLNRLTGPAIRSGFGPYLATPATGYMMLLRTTGHRSGRVREAPVGYTLLDGDIVVMAGYGRGTHWFRNALANPHVEVALPGAVLAGTASEISDADDRRHAFRELYAALGVVGRAVLPEAATAPDARLDEIADAIPVLRIRPTAVLPGPYDPGGSFWRYPLVAGAAFAVLLALSRRRAARESTQPPSPWTIRS